MRAPGHRLCLLPCEQPQRRLAACTRTRALPVRRTLTSSEREAKEKDLQSPKRCTCVTSARLRCEARRILQIFSHHEARCEKHGAAGGTAPLQP